jgi:hypothetical protein
VAPRQGPIALAAPGCLETRTREQAEACAPTAYGQEALPEPSPQDKSPTGVKRELSARLHGEMERLADPARRWFSRIRDVY